MSFTQRLHQKLRFRLFQHRLSANRPPQLFDVVTTPPVLKHDIDRLTSKISAKGVHVVWAPSGTGLGTKILVGTLSPRFPNVLFLDAIRSTTCDSDRECMYSLIQRHCGIPALGKYNRPCISSQLFPPEFEGRIYFVMDRLNEWPGSKENMSRVLLLLANESVDHDLFTTVVATTDPVLARDICDMNTGQKFFLTAATRWTEQDIDMLIPKDHKHRQVLMQIGLLSSNPQLVSSMARLELDLFLEDAFRLAQSYRSLWDFGEQILHEHL